MLHVWINVLLNKSTFLCKLVDFVEVIDECNGTNKENFGKN